MTGAERNRALRARKARRTKIDVDALCHALVAAYSNPRTADLVGYHLRDACRAIRLRVATLAKSGVGFSVRAEPTPLWTAYLQWHARDPAEWPLPILAPAPPPAEAVKPSRDEKG